MRPGVVRARSSLSCREVYLAEPEAVGEDEPLYDIAYPIGGPHRLDWPSAVAGVPPPSITAHYTLRLGPVLSTPAAIAVGRVRVERMI